MKFRVRARAFLNAGAAVLAFLATGSAALISNQAVPFLAPQWPQDQFAEPEQVAPLAPSAPYASFQQGAAYPASREDAAPQVPVTGGQAPAGMALVAWGSSPAPQPPEAPSAAAQSATACECARTAEAPAATAPVCKISKVSLRQDQTSNYGISLSELNSMYGEGARNTAQQEAVVLAPVSTTPFMCLDDRLTEPSLSTPGGELGEFINAVSAYLQEVGSQPSQEIVHALFLKYLETLPPERAMVHCTDERAIRHLQADTHLAIVDLQRPRLQQNEAVSLLEKLTEAENHGDSHIRLMLEQPQWFQLDPRLVPMVLRSFYTLLWQQNEEADRLPQQIPRLELRVLRGEPSPQAFLEVSSGELCFRSGMAPMMVPRDGRHSFFISHFDAVSMRREELAALFSSLPLGTPRKLDRETLYQRINRHGWLALETTGSRIASGLPFFSIGYA